MIFIGLLKKLQYNSPVVLTFALLSLGVLGLSKLTNGLSDRVLFSVYRSPLTDFLTYPRMVLHVLGHSGLEHYMSNMLLMLVIGPALEDKYKSKTLFWTIFATALITGIAQWALFPKTALMGASGIVFMMIIMSSLSGMKNGRIPITLIFVIVFYMGAELATGLTTTDDIAQFTHFIGGMCGGFIGSRLASRSSSQLPQQRRLAKL